MSRGQLRPLCAWLIFVPWPCLYKIKCLLKEPSAVACVYNTSSDCRMIWQPNECPSPCCILPSLLFFSFFQPFDICLLCISHSVYLFLHFTTSLNFLFPIFIHSTSFYSLQRMHNSQSISALISFAQVEHWKSENEWLRVLTRKCNLKSGWNEIDI